MTFESFVSSDILNTLRFILPADQKMYLVGGAVRDALLGKSAHDLDFCLEADPSPFARRVARHLEGAFFSLDDERGTVRVLCTYPNGQRYSIDFARFRGADLEADLRGRDFTINAMAVNLHAPQVLIDPLNGRADLLAKQLRSCSEFSLREDPLRVLRGIRLATSFDFKIVEETRQLMQAAVPQLEAVSPERRRDELFRILEGPRPVPALRLLDALGVFPFLLPELQHLKDIPQPAPHTLDVWNHTLATLDALHTLLDVLDGAEGTQELPAWIWQMARERLGKFHEPLQAHFAQSLNPNRSLMGVLSLAVLYHDVAKPVTSEDDGPGTIQYLGHEKIGAEAAMIRAQTLQLSKVECERIRTIIRQHIRVHSLVQTGEAPTPRAVYRYFRDMGDAGVDVCLHTLADVLAIYGPTLSTALWATYLDTCRSLLESWWEKPRASVLPKGILNGHDLLTELKVPPGPRMGLLLEALREAQVAGNIHNREEALAFAQKWLKVYPGRQA